MALGCSPFSLRGRLIPLFSADWKLNCPIFEPNFIDFLKMSGVVGNHRQLMSDGGNANKKIKVVERCAYSL